MNVSIRRARSEAAVTFPGSEDFGAEEAPTPMLVHAEEAMGTVFSFRVPLSAGSPPEKEVARLVRSACRLVHHHDALFSLWRADSALCRLRAGLLTLGRAPDELREVLEDCASAKELSGGWFDPWKMPGGVDPTGLVKGWSARQALGVLVSGGIGSALLNAGGDVVATGRAATGGPWRVGIRHPWRADALACMVALVAAVATSGAYERGPHLVDPHTGRPASSCASASVTGPDLAIADALATGLAAGGEAAMPAIEVLEGYEGYLVLQDGSERWTPGFGFCE